MLSIRVQTTLSDSNARKNQSMKLKPNSMPIPKCRLHPMELVKMFLVQIRRTSLETRLPLTVAPMPLLREALLLQP